LKLLLIISVFHLHYLFFFLIFQLYQKVIFFKIIINFYFLSFQSRTKLKAAEFGAKVMINGRRDKGKEVLEEITKNGGIASFSKIDVTKEEDIKRAIDTTINKFGKLDGAVNYAGIDLANGYIHQQVSKIFNKRRNYFWQCKGLIIFFKILKKN
jgi:enoyl-[acyl-carrier-protein] reductase (NADH)